MYALFVAALILARFAVERRASLWLIATIAAIVLRVTAPIERYALVRIHALKVGRRAVGPAGASILGQHKVIGAGALVVWRFRREQTEGRTVGMQARIATDWLLLAIGMIDTQVHRPVYCRDKRGAILTVVLVAVLNGLGLPVRPIDAILPHGNGKYMMQIQTRIDAARQQQTRMIAIQVADRNRVLSGITPEQLLCFEANGQGIGPAQILAYDHARL